MHGEFFIPIIFFLVIGVITVTAIFFRSKEKQMMIEKGLTSEQIKELYQRKRDPNVLMKIGIILFFFGLGLGLGLWLEDMNFNHRDYGNEYWVPLCIFTFTGAGFIIANFADRFNKGKEIKSF